MHGYVTAFPIPARLCVRDELPDAEVDGMWWYAAHQAFGDLWGKVSPAEVRS